MPKLIASSPVLLVKDVAASAAYYRNCAGFTPGEFVGDPPVFCIIERDRQFLMLARVEDASKIVPHWKIRAKTFSAYYWVTEIDALFEQMKATCAKIDSAPEDRIYGVREFGIQDPDGHVITFGEIIRR